MPRPRAHQDGIPLPGTPAHAMGRNAASAANQDVSLAWAGARLGSLGLGLPGGAHQQDARQDRPRRERVQGGGGPGQVLVPAWSGARAADRCLSNRSTVAPRSVIENGLARQPGIEGLEPSLRSAAAGSADM
jgi:hypothetical protein